MKIRILFFISVVCMMASPIWGDSEGLKHELAERVEVSASVNETSVLIGDLIQYELSTDAPKNSEVKLIIAEGEEQWGGLALREFHEEPAKPSGKNRERHVKRFELESLIPGSYVIPSHEILVTEPGAEPIKVSSQEIFVEVRSSLEDGKELELRGIKPPVEVERNLTKFYLIVAAVLLILGLAYLGRKYYSGSKKEPANTKDVLPPHVIALNELKNIQSDDLIRQSKTKEYFYRVSNCIRFYIEGRFGIRAPECSTEEFVDEAIASRKLEAKHINLLKEFLTACDLVKYSQSDSDIEQANEIYRTAENFVLETQPKEEIPESLSEVQS